MSRPRDLPDRHRRHLEELTSRCPEMATLTARVREFAAILAHRRGTELDTWIPKPGPTRTDDFKAGNEDVKAEMLGERDTLAPHRHAARVNPNETTRNFAKNVAQSALAAEATTTCTMVPCG